MIDIKQNVKQKNKWNLSSKLFIENKINLYIKTFNELTELDKQFLQECDSYNKIQGLHSFYKSRGLPGKL